jgi:hypothetical protein
MLKALEGIAVHLDDTICLSIAVPIGFDVESLAAQVSRDKGTSGSQMP